MGFLNDLASCIHNCTRLDKPCTTQSILSEPMLYCPLVVPVTFVSPCTDLGRFVRQENMTPLLDVCLHLEALAIQMIQRPENDLSYVEELLGNFGVCKALRE